MKIKKVVSGVLVLAALATSAIIASAKNEIADTSKDWNMGKSYSKMTENKVGYTNYHVGSTNWFDDVSAYTETKVASGMVDGFATVRLKAENGTISIKNAYKFIDNSYIRTDNAGVAGQDRAERVQFSGARKDIGQDYVGFVHTIY